MPVARRGLLQVLLSGYFEASRRSFVPFNNVAHSHFVWELREWCAGRARHGDRW